MPDLNMPADRVYLEFGATTVIVGESGLVGMPVAGPPVPGPTRRYVRTQQDVSWKVISWAAVCLAGNPQCPHPDTGSVNDQFKRYVLGGTTPGRLPDGTAIVTVFGQYLYEMQAPFVPGVDALPLGTTPFVNVPAGLNRIDPTDFVKNLLGPVPQLASELNLSKIGY